MEFGKGETVWLLNDRVVREGVWFPTKRIVHEQTPCTVSMVGFGDRREVRLPSGDKKWTTVDKLEERRVTVYA